MWRHIVFFKLHDGVDEAEVQNALKVLGELGHDNPDIREWNVTESLDVRKGRIIVQNGLFNSRETFERFQSSDKHRAAGELMKNIADWWIGDYEA